MDERMFVIWICVESSFRERIDTWGYVIWNSCI